MIEFINTVNNPDFCFDKMHVTTNFLIGVANGTISLKSVAIAQLKERGLDENGKRIKK